MHPGLRGTALLARVFRASLGLGCGALLAACTGPALVASAAGIATDTSVTWEIVKHVHGKLTEGDAVPCARLDGLQRALNPRCGPYQPGRIAAADLRRADLQGCVLTLAVRDARVWPALPDLLDAGAKPADCARSPWVELAAADPCADWTAAAPAVLAALRTIAEEDPRAVRHDVIRVLTCPTAVQVGLDQVLSTWLMRGWLDADQVGFGALGALHPRYLTGPFARVLESRGHRPRAALGPTGGVQPGGFEAALRLSDWAALDWWLTRAPDLVDRVPAVQGNQLPWLPLVKVLTPNFLAHPETRDAMVGFLLARGADPRKKLPHDAGRSVVDYARALRSPSLALLEAPASIAPASPLTGSLAVAGRSAAVP